MLSRTWYLLLCLLVFTTGCSLAAERNIRTYGAKCDGVTNDATAVQAAIDDARPGDVILVPGPKLTGIADPGFTMDGRTRLTIRGVDGGGFSILSDTKRGMNGFSYVMNVMHNCTECTVERLFFQGNGRNATVLGLDQNTHCTVQDITITNVGTFTGRNADSPSAALATTGNERNVYQRIYIDTTAAFPKSDGVRGMWIGNGNPGQYEDHPVITGCKVANTGYTGIGGHPIAAWVYDNEVWGTKGGACIKQVPAPPAVSTERTLIENNYCHDSDSQGIQLDGTHHVVVRNNLLVRNSCAGVFLSPGQPAQKMKDEGIANGCMDVLVTGNTILDSGPVMMLGGIMVHGASNLEISHNTIRDTHLPQQKVMYSGISLNADYNAYENIRIFDNIIEGAIFNGISAWGGKQPYSKVTLANNILKANAQRGIFVEGKAITQQMQAYGNIYAGNGIAPIAGIAETKQP